MKRETRVYAIRTAEEHEVSNQYFNLPLVLAYKGKTCVIGSGRNDSISVFRGEGKNFVVLSYNRSIEYVGIEVINGETLEKVDEGLFLQNGEEIASAFDLNDADKFFDYSENYMAELLYNLYCEIHY